MDSVISWVKQIFILSILSNIVTHLMPSPKYAKYASYICGLLVIMVCVVPLAGLLNGKLSFDEIYTSIISYEDAKRLEKELTYQQGDSAAAVIAEYEKEVAKTVDEKVLESGYYPAKTTVVIDSDSESPDYGTIQKVTVLVSNQKESGGIVVDSITIGTREAVSEDYTDLRNELAELLHTTLSRVEISSK